MHSKVDSNMHVSVEEMLTPKTTKAIKGAGGKGHAFLGYKFWQHVKLVGFIRIHYYLFEQVLNKNAHDTSMHNLCFVSSRSLPE